MLATRSNSRGHSITPKVIITQKPGTAENNAANPRRIRRNNNNLYGTSRYENMFRFGPLDDNIKSLIDSTRIPTPHDSSTTQE